MRIIFIVSVVACMAGFIKSSPSLETTSLIKSPSPEAESKIRIIPKPMKVTEGEGSYSFSANSVIRLSSPELKSTAEYLANLFGRATGLKPRVVMTGSDEGISLTIDKSLDSLGSEGYLLQANEKGISISAAAPAGIFYGVQTLRQLLPTEFEKGHLVEGVEWKVPFVTIEDRPRFSWRGYLLDPARHFRTKDEIKRCIDLLAFQKINKLQLHFTDDQGWRIEIKKYPKLTSVGASVPDYSGYTGKNWFYSQDDIREIVAYAASRYITVIPEIEMPGHSRASTTAYPELGCDGRSSGELCVSNPAAFEFATGVLTEVMDLFPSEYIHVGADEVRAERWRACSRCSREMERLQKIPLPSDVLVSKVEVRTGAGFQYHADVSRLQGEFDRRIDSFIASKGKKMIGWDEILEGGLKKGTPATVMAWRSESAISGALQQDRDIINTVCPDYYLDIDIPLERTYNFDPVPDSLSKEQALRIIGMQGNMWGERTPAIQNVEAQSFPRVSAIAEIGWTSRAQRDFNDFLDRFVPFSRRLDFLGVVYRRPDDLRW